MKAFHEVRNYPSDFMVWHKSYWNISFIAHWHREIELLYIKSGEIKMQVNNYSFTATAGDLIVCDTGDIHYSNSYQDNSCLDFLLFDTSLLGTHYQYQYFSTPLLKKAQLSHFGFDKLLLEVEHLIDQEMSEQKEYYQNIIQANIQNLWYNLLRIMPVETDLNIIHNRRNSLLVDLQKLLTYMEDHINENISLETAASMMHFSPSHFSKIFKQLIGVNYIKYLNILRITKASEMLCNSDVTITQTAYHCGFQNIRTFNRVFKEITGQTPSNYLKISDSSNPNFTYYKSNSDVMAYAEKDPLTIIKKEP